jgi:hypothetical protein
MQLGFLALPQYMHGPSGIPDAECSCQRLAGLTVAAGAMFSLLMERLIASSDFDA